MSTYLGPALKQARQAQHLSQQTVAAGICAQSMLSAIEHNHYVPNADLLIKLCQRLNLSLDALSLADNYAISQKPDFNQRLVTLCNAHAYTQLADFLAQPAVLDQVSTAAQTQAYYYYLGVAQFQTKQALTTVQQTFQLAGC